MENSSLFSPPITIPQPSVFHCILVVGIAWHGMPGWWWVRSLESAMRESRVIVSLRKSTNNTKTSFSILPKLLVKCSPAHYQLRRHAPAPRGSWMKSPLPSHRKTRDHLLIALPSQQMTHEVDPSFSRHGLLLYFLSPNKINNSECLAGSQRPLRFNSSSSACES